MRKLFSVFLALGMLFTGFMGAVAQDAPAASSFAFGMDSPATWTDVRGNNVATVAVNGIDTEWADNSEYSEPEQGYTFQAVTFTVTNVSDASLIVEPYDFSLVDAEGHNNGRTYVSLSEEAEGTIFEDDTPLAAGESAELTMVYQLPEGVAASTFVWQPDSGVLVMVNFGETGGENAAIASGFNAPSTWIDEQGNPVATLEVTEIDEDWQDFGEYDEPERGMVFRAVHVKITNISGASLIIEPYSFTLLDSTGMNNGRSWAEAAEGSDTKVLSDDTPLGDGEAFEGVIVFEMYPDITPTAVMWQPDSGLLNMVIVADGAASSGGTDTVATPESDDAAATPAAESDDDAAAATVEEDDAAADDEDADGGSDAAVASSGSDQTLITSEPQPLHDAVGEEQGNVTVYSTQDNWDGYDEAANPPTEGTRFFLVTLDVEVTGMGFMPVSPLDFTVISENGGSYQSDLYLNADDAEVEITESGIQIDEGTTQTIVIPFMVPEGETPVSLEWNTGTETIEFSLVP